VQLYGHVDAESIIRTVRDGFKPLIVGHVSERGFAEPIAALLDACGEHRPVGIVLDAFDASRLGGTGQPFHWPWLVEAREAGELDGWPPILLAGGLGPDNVAEAVTQTQPWGIDVASGVESAPGHKDFDKMSRLIKAARAAATNCE
jgi:phosphoribosylanthranilate isomerase